MIIDYSIPKTVRKAIAELNKDVEFDKIFNEDKELSDLFDRTTDYEVETQLLQLNCTGNVIIAGIECLGYSMLAINILWLLRSPVLFDVNKVKDDDLAVATWLLFNSDVDLKDLPKLKETTKNFLDDNNILPEVALTLVMRNLQLAFYPLRYILTNNENKMSANPVFDQLWATNLISIVSKCVSNKSEEIMRMPLATCYLYYVNYLRQQGNTSVVRFTDDEIQADIELRTCELIVDYFVQKKIINSKDRDKIFASLTKDHQKDFKIVGPKKPRKTRKTKKTDEAEATKNNEEAEK